VSTATATARDDLGVVTTPARAATLLKPLRLRILAHASAPASASTIAAALNLPRQRVNYHVRELARAGFLRKAGRAQKRGLTEQRYVVSARSYVLAPGVLGAVGTRSATQVADRTSAAYLLALAGQMQRELTATSRATQTGSNKRVPTIAIDTEFVFASPAQRARFAGALTTAITKVVAEHTESARATAGQTTRRYRLAVGCYPIPQDEP
jgi:hypothetical protein